MSAGQERNLGLRTHVDALLDIAGDVSNLRIVDLGCGEGHFARGLAARVPKSSASIHSLCRCRSSGSQQVAFVFCKREPKLFRCRPPWRTSLLSSFRYTMCRPLFSRQPFEEAKRLLRPSGRLYVAEPLEGAAVSPHPALSRRDASENKRADGACRIHQPQFEAAEIFHYDGASCIRRF